MLVIKMVSPWKHLVISTLLWIQTTTGQNITDIEIDLQHKIPIIINDDETASTLIFKYNVTGTENIEALLYIENIKKASLISDFLFPMNKSSEGNFSVQLKGNVLGRTYLSIFLRANNGELQLNETFYNKYELVVARVTRPIDTVFNIVIILLVICANVAMGCKVDISVVKDSLKRPIAPGIGVFAQFVFMPGIAFLTVYLLDLEPAIALGYFALGCSPGGSASNIYTYMFDGDVSLSITMTLISTFCSLGLIPLWLFTVGQMVIYKGTSMNIPFQNIFISLFALLIPVVVGMIIQHKKPNWAAKIMKLLNPLVIIFLIFVLTVGIYANLYIFTLLEPLVLLAGALIPYLGFAFGLLFSFVARQPKKNIIAIAIETGIQNTGIPIILLRNSLDPPESDISIVGPVASAIFTPLPLVVALIVIAIRKRFCQKFSHDLIMNPADNPATFSNVRDDSSPKVKS